MEVTDSDALSRVDFWEFGVSVSPTWSPTLLRLHKGGSQHSGTISRKPFLWGEKDKSKAVSIPKVRHVARIVGLELLKVCLCGIKGPGEQGVGLCKVGKRRFGRQQKKSKVARGPLWQIAPLHTYKRRVRKQVNVTLFTCLGMVPTCLT